MAVLDTGRPAKCGSIPAPDFCNNPLPHAIIALFLLRFRRGRFGEFLEAQIIPERIEHGIEPEQCRSVWRKLSEKFSLYCFGAREATIFSKRGSLRNASSTGLILISNASRLRSSTE